MTWTTHGYHIDGTEMELDVARPRTPTCGGPGMCGKCSAEAARVMNKIRAVATRNVEEHWVRKPARVVAIFWDGTAEQAGPVVSWLRENVHSETRLRGKVNAIIMIGVPGGEERYLGPNEVFVQHENGEFQILSEKDFRHDFDIDTDW